MHFDDSAFHRGYNRPFLNFLWPLFQSESWSSSFHMKISFHLHVNWMKTNFHMKGWAPRLALKKRPKVIRKWSIEVSFIMAVICRVCQNRGMCDHVWGLLSSSFFCWFFNTVSYHFCTNHPFMHVVCKLFPHHVSDGVGLSVIMLIIIIIIIIMFNISNNNNNV